MQRRFAPSLFSKAIALGAIVAFCVGGMSVSASAAPEANSRAAHVASGDERIYKGSATFLVENGVGDRFHLGEGKLWPSWQMESSQLMEAPNLPPKLVATWKASALGGGSVMAELPIYDGAFPTRYYVHGIILLWDNATPQMLCEIYKGPVDHGYKPWKPPYVCEISRHWWDYDWDLTIKRAPSV
jgi:hypothetical protein